MISSHSIDSINSVTDRPRFDMDTISRSDSRTFSISTPPRPPRSRRSPDRYSERSETPETPEPVINKGVFLNVETKDESEATVSGMTDLPTYN